jgi:glycosyltransferase involved in cell wall biosynthesis
MAKSNSPAILFLSSYPPRECGIATFTKRLTTAFDNEVNPEIKSKILAINDGETSMYNYPRKVVMQLNEGEIEDYLNRANEINRSPYIKLVNVQHEYGLFGGDTGDYLIPFLEILKKPCVVTFHTTLPRPEDKMKKVAKTISEKAEAVVVMNHTAKNILHEVYGIKKNKIHLIPHGVFHVPFPSKSKAKKKLNLGDRLVISTFGMISRDKGIEYAIEALPEVIAQHPNILYLIIGATHPVVLRREGEKYRNKLIRLVAKLQLENYVKFYNRYLEEWEITEYLKATDIYVYPMLSKEQASSGSLSDAMSCACPVITTGSQYAKSVINRERGILVRFRNSADIKKALLEMIADKKMRKEMARNTYFYTRHMTWQNVALSYFNLFNNFAKIVPKRKDKLPPINTKYLKVLTDKFGIIQFASHTKPDTHSGYCLDDNARALIGFTQLYEKKKNKTILEAIAVYLRFIKFTQKKNGRFHNMVSYNRNFIEQTESEDAFGRAIWSLGFLISREYLPENFKKQANGILKKALKWTEELESLRAIAFSIIGLCHITEKENNPEILRPINKLAQKLVNSYEQEQNKDNGNDDGWHWFENCLTYSNYKLPEALFRAYKITNNKTYLEVAEKTINFLSSVTFENKNYFSPIGQDGWYFRGGKRSYFDQQPEDASSGVEALAAAYALTKNKIYKEQAKLSFEWFLGKNHLNQMVYDEATGGCYDGLGRFSLNFNQGAESTLSYFLARLTIEGIYN